jgi:hypothetical protein
MSGGFDRSDFSVVVKHRAPMPRPWRWEIYRAGRQSPVAHSRKYFDLRRAAELEGKAALDQLLEKMKF